jgi:hypothetical protein
MILLILYLETVVFLFLSSHLPLTQRLTTPLAVQSLSKVHSEPASMITKYANNAIIIILIIIKNWSFAYILFEMTQINKMRFN